MMLLLVFCIPRLLEAKFYCFLVSCRLHLCPCKQGDDSEWFHETLGNKPPLCCAKKPWLIRDDISRLPTHSYGSLKVQRLIVDDFHPEQLLVSLASFTVKMVIIPRRIQIIMFSDHVSGHLPLGLFRKIWSPLIMAQPLPTSLPTWRFSSHVSLFWTHLRWCPFSFAK